MSKAPNARRAGLAAIALSTALIAAGYGSAFLPGGAPGWSAWTFVLGIPCMVVGLMALGAARSGGGLGRLALPFTFIWLVLALGFGIVLVLAPAEGPETTLWLGLPPRAAIVMYGIGLAPVFVLPLAYALTFDEFTLNESDLERVRAAARVSAQNGPAEPTR